ncbi:hypothetical protein A3Q56_02513 [Intoshia linei]|uniref:Reverse transcriptase RNase H-like domain-containing protein n=1 Tax=Intoshia linei TaxID=1819745 RepID=A0A177B8H3_9BILA|nr:hypothetical protein A3Q56_02513 [Intoshia linei]
MRKWHNYVYRCHIILRTDHLPLVHIMKTVTKGHAAARIKRWSIFLREYTLEHIPGRMNEVADCFSRLPCDQEVERIDQLSIIFLWFIEPQIIPQLGFRHPK